MSQKTILYRGPLAGVTFEPAKGNLREVSLLPISEITENMSMVHDYANKYDPNAVSVRVQDKHIGFIPKKDNQSVLPHINEAEIEVGWFNYNDFGVAIGMMVVVYI